MIYGYYLFTTHPEPGFLNTFNYTKQGQMFDAAASARSITK
jgi:hypothetical protein